ncbi:hypothetical protein BpHYR1_052745 [Brachionus plicatilis]|uniref:Uncharacterized protein n=1 Tax=Brachionus plicatilis TaxID=10195 RepID=A0A3M7R8P9_BRAPC|nr:hypothetical protein BpHYR1_052745 [Brachionus plicatilis]
MIECIPKIFCKSFNLQPNGGPFKDGNSESKKITKQFQAIFHKMELSLRMIFFLVQIILKDDIVFIHSNKYSCDLNKFCKYHPNIFSATTQQFNFNNLLILCLCFEDLQILRFNNIDLNMNRRLQDINL